MVACFCVCVTEQHVSCSFNSTVIYLEGNLETKIFTDPVTGLVRRIREVAIRRNGTNGSTPKTPFLTYFIGKQLNPDLCFLSLQAELCFWEKPVICSNRVLLSLEALATIDF